MLDSSKRGDYNLKRVLFYVATVVKDDVTRSVCNWWKRELYWMVIFVYGKSKERKRA